MGQIIKGRWVRAESTGGWVSAELEPDEGRYLVFTEHVMYGKEKYWQRDITIGSFEYGEWKCANYLGNRVLAWMRLPEPPKEGKET